jgi:alkanesulfonate monooxygenase
MVEYTHIISELLKGKTVSFAGEFYTVKQLSLQPALPPELFPLMLASGSSSAGLDAARAINATAIQYPGPPGEFNAPAEPGAYGLRVGLIARQQEDDAWQIAEARFPQDRRGELTHELAMKVSDSHWHKQLSARPQDDRRTPYWLGPFQHSKSNCPYLVGSYEQVAGELARYLLAGFETFILDIPPAKEELDHASVVFGKAAVQARAAA